VVLAQYRVNGRWCARVRYTTTPGITYEHPRWADELGRVDEHGPPARTVTVNPRPVTGWGHSWG